MRESKFVICGAGPIGLYVAIRLVNCGVKSQNITVVDRHAGAYYRPGTVDNDLIENELIKYNIKPSNFYHIKDVERGLYCLANNLNIKFEKKEFVGFIVNNTIEKMVVIKDSEKTIELPADYILDCTGSKRAVLHKVNSVLEENFFEVIKAASPPIENHILAYVHMDSKSKKSLGIVGLGLHRPPAALDIPDTDNFYRTITNLKKLGWKENILPDMWSISLEKNKACFYMEAPNDIQPDKYDAWVSQVFKIYQKEKESEDVKYNKIFGKNNEKKPTFVSFKSFPSMINKLTYLGDNLPIIIPLGDSQIESDYRLGNGIKLGKERSDAFISSLIIKDHVVNFDNKKYESLVFKQINELKEKLEALYKKRRDDIVKCNILFTELDLRNQYRQQLSLFHESAYANFLKKSENYVLENPEDTPYLSAIRTTKF